MMPEESDWTRREILHTVAAVAWRRRSAARVIGRKAKTGPIRSGFVAKTRCRVLATGWRPMSSSPRTKYRCPWIEGYASRTSVRPGELITLHVSTNPPSTVHIDIYRLGYYQGHGGRLVMKIGPFTGPYSRIRPIGPKRLRECNWAPSAGITNPDDWVSGVYLAKLTAEREGLQSYIIFVVRDDRPVRLPLPGLRHDLERL